VKLLNRAFNADDPAAFALPTRAGAARALIFFLGDALTEGPVDIRFRVANHPVRTAISSSAKVHDLMTRLEARL
jgi:hypothetical protein